MNKLLIFRVQFYNQLLLDVLGDVLTCGNVEELTSFQRLVPLNPRILAVVETCQSSLNHLKRLRLLANTNYIAGLNNARGDVYHLTVDR